MRLVCGERADGPRRVIADACAARGARFVDAHDGASVTAAMTAGETEATIRTPVAEYGAVTLGLRGRHQAQNALVAVRLLECLSEAGVPVGREAVERGLREARWAGRLDWRTVAGGRRALLDAAHNPAGAATLAEYLAAAVPGGQPLVFGAARDKDHRGMLRHLLPHARPLVLTVPPTPRATDPDVLAAAARAVDPGAPVLVARDPAAALELAWSFAPAITVAGSIFLVGAVLPSLEARGAP